MRARRHVQVLTASIPTPDRAAIKRALLALFAIAMLSASACSEDEESNDSEPDVSDAVEEDGEDSIDEDMQEESDSADLFDPTTLPSRAPEEIGGERPAVVHAPEDYDRTRSYPIVIMLHGYGANGFVQDLAIFKLSQRVTEEQFVLVIPDGTTDSSGSQFWNGTSQCCDFEDYGVDDVAYLAGLVDEAREKMNIDRERVAFVGHSNGGYMSYRMACERPDIVDRIAVLAGSTWLDAEDCLNPEATSVLQIHGTADDTIPYDETGEDGPGRTTIGAEATVARWRARAGCADEPTTETTADLDAVLEGEETDIIEWTDCTSGERVDLWRINGGDHIRLTFNQTFSDRLTDWLLAP